MNTITGVAGVAVLAVLGAALVLCSGDGQAPVSAPPLPLQARPGAVVNPLVSPIERAPPGREPARAVPAPAASSAVVAADLDPQAPPPRATRSAPWESLRARLEARLGQLADRPRPASLAFTDFVQRERLDVGALGDTDLADLCDGFALLAELRQAELEPYVVEGDAAAASPEWCEAQVRAVQERFALCERDLARGFATR